MAASPGIEKRHERKAQQTEHHAWLEQQTANQLTHSPGAEEVNSYTSSTCDTSSTSPVSSSLSSFSGDSPQDSDSDGSAKDETCSPSDAERALMSHKWQLYPINEGASIDAPAPERVLEEISYKARANVGMDGNIQSPPMGNMFSERLSTHPEQMKKLEMKAQAEKNTGFKSQHTRLNWGQQTEEVEAANFFEEMFQLLESGISKSTTNQKKKLEGASLKEDSLKDFATSTCDVPLARVEEKVTAELGELDTTVRTQDAATFHDDPRSVGASQDIAPIASHAWDIATTTSHDFRHTQNNSQSAGASQDIAAVASHDVRHTHDQHSDAESPSCHKIMSDLGSCLGRTRETDLDVDKLKEVHTILSQVQVAVEALQLDKETWTKLEEEFAKSMQSVDTCARSASMATACKAATVEPASHCDSTSVMCASVAVASKAAPVEPASDCDSTSVRSASMAAAVKTATVEPATDPDNEMWTKLEEEFEKYMHSSDARFKSPSMAASSSAATVDSTSPATATVELETKLETKPLSLKAVAAPFSQALETCMRSADARFRSPSRAVSSTIATSDSTLPAIATVELESRPMATSRVGAAPFSSPVAVSRACSPGCPRLEPRAATVEPTSTNATTELETQPIATSRIRAAPFSSPVAVSRAISPNAPTPERRMTNRSHSPVAVARSLSVPQCPSVAPSFPSMQASQVVRKPTVVPARPRSVSVLAPSVARSVSSSTQPCPSPTTDPPITTAVSRRVSVAHPGKGGSVELPHPRKGGSVELSNPRRGGSVELGFPRRGGSVELGYPRRGASVELRIGPPRHKTNRQN